MITYIGSLGKKHLINFINEFYSLLRKKGLKIQTGVGSMDYGVIEEKKNDLF